MTRYLREIAIVTGVIFAGIGSFAVPASANPLGVEQFDNNDLAGGPKNQPRAAKKPRARSVGELEKALTKAPRPGRKPQRRTVEEVKNSYPLRRRLRHVDIDTINFEFDSATLGPGEARKLSRLARAMRNILDRRPYEVFLIEGHTDAVGNGEYNLYLSEDRARVVRRTLVRHFGLPRYSLETAGYGEQFLKIKSYDRERRNRRVTVRRITDLISPRRARLGAVGRYRPRRYRDVYVDRYDPYPPPYIARRYGRRYYD